MTEAEAERGRTPVRVQLRRTKGWRMPPNTVSVARPGRWGNPFSVDLVGSRELAVQLFREWMTLGFDPGKLAHLTDADFNSVYRDMEAATERLGWGIEKAAGARSELAGKNLACWCQLDQPCHADVLLALARTYFARPARLGDGASG